MDATHEILVADYHRNGVGGAGFYVAIVNTINEEGTRQYLCVDFIGHPEDDSFDTGRFAVLEMSELCKGNIGMHPIDHPEGFQIEGQGGNAWRGADHWGTDLHERIRDWVSKSSDASMARFAAERAEVKS